MGLLAEHGVVAHGVEDASRSFERAQGAVEEMRVLGVHRQVVDGVAKAFHLVDELAFHSIRGFERVGDGVAAEVVVLDRSWVAIMVAYFPISFVCLVNLVGHVFQMHFLGWHDELAPAVPSLGLGSQEGKDWYTAYSPVLSRLGQIFGADCQSSEASVEQSGGGKTKGRS